MTKREADVVEQTVYSINEREYWGLVGWLANGCDGPLWNAVRPWRPKREAHEAAVALGGDAA
jgi:hypothetical protein